MAFVLFLVLIAGAFAAARVALDAIVPLEISARRVGGLTFVRFGRLSFSYSIRRA